MYAPLLHMKNDTVPGPVNAWPPANFISAVLTIVALELVMRRITTLPSKLPPLKLYSVVATDGVNAHSEAIEGSVRVLEITLLSVSAVGSVKSAIAPRLSRGAVAVPEATIVWP